MLRLHRYSFAVSCIAPLQRLPCWLWFQLPRPLSIRAAGVPIGATAQKAQWWAVSQLVQPPAPACSTGNFHNRAKLQGCVAGSGDKLIDEKDNQTYNLTTKQNESLKPGERVELLGKKIKDASGDPTFEVHKMSKDLGQCKVTTAE
jgi:hypothetical protein